LLSLFSDQIQRAFGRTPAKYARRRR
jgi:hypothetical protein